MLNQSKDNLKASEELKEIKEKLGQIMKENENAVLSAEKAENERREIKKYAQELVERVKLDAGSQQYMIDRRMIT